MIIYKEKPYVISNDGIPLCDTCKLYSYYMKCFLGLINTSKPNML
jgi:hypothetical protein